MLSSPSRLSSHLPSPSRQSSHLPSPSRLSSHLHSPSSASLLLGCHHTSPLLLGCHHTSTPHHPPLSSLPTHHPPLSSPPHLSLSPLPIIRLSPHHQFLRQATRAFHARLPPLSVPALPPRSPSYLPNTKKREKRRHHLFSLSCTPSGARTLDPLIKSQLLYQLS